MKNRNLLVIALVLLGLLAIAVLFYKSTTATGDNLLSKEQVCDFPCWQQITPQETNFAEALSKMREKDLIIFADENEIEVQINDVSGFVNRSSDGKVGFIVLYVKYQAARLSDVVQLIGAPEKMLIGPKPSPSDHCHVHLLFPKNGTIVELYPKNKNKDKFSCRVSISPESRVFRIVLLGYDLYDNDYWKRSYENSEFIEWNGYGTYSK